MRHSIVLAALVACATGETQREDLDKALNWDEGFEDVVQVNPTDTDDPTGYTPPPNPFLFHLDAPQRNYPIFLQTWDPVTRTVNEGEACEVDLTNLEAGDHLVQYCMMDVNELDLWVLGYPLDVNVPGGTCDFYLVDWYQYEDYYTDVGPTDLNITIQPDGTIVDDIYTFFGEPFCPWNYEPYGPNCCIGNYSITINDQISGQIYTVPYTWGGRAGDCYDGTSYIMGTQFTDDGFPYSEIVFTDKQAYTAHYEVNGFDDGEYGTNVGVANYYDPADHNDNRPAGLNTIDLNGNGQLDPGDHASFARQYNSFYCMDDAWEIYAELRLIVREWNTEEQFNLRAAGDSDIEGFESGPAGEPDSRSPLNDLADWQNLAPSDVVWTSDRD